MMKSVDEMFEDLVFKEWFGEECMSYEDTNGNLICFIHYYKIVKFYLAQKEFVLSMELLDLIKMKCKEIGWLNEND